MEQAATAMVLAVLIALLGTFGCSTPSHGVSGFPGGQSPASASPHLNESMLEGTTWYLVVFHTASGRSSETIPGSEITLFLDGNGKISGNAGCNQYSASYTTSADLLSIGSTAATKKYCASPDGMMAQETAFLSMLQRVVHSRVEGNILTMTDKNRIPLASFSNIKPAP